LLVIFSPKLAKSVILRAVREGGVLACVNGKNGHI